MAGKRPAAERRIGSRGPVPGRVRLEGPRSGRDSSPAGRKLRPGGDQGHLLIEADLLDVSVTGVAVAGPSHPELEVGRHVVIRSNDLHGEVAVRRSQQRDDGSIVYGLEFVGDHLELRDHLGDAAGLFYPGYEWASEARRNEA